VVPPEGAPNVLLIITDDAQHLRRRHPGAMLDRIANDGLRSNRVFSTALCSPTRAALITGRNHHSAGFGVIVEQATGYPGYDSFLQKDKATIGRMLLDNGYNTAWFGKDHNTPAFEASQSGRSISDRPAWASSISAASSAATPTSGSRTSSQHDADLSLRRSGAGDVEPGHGDGGRRDRLDHADAADQSGQAVSRHVCARRHARAAPPDQGVGRQDQHNAPVRRRLEQAARDDLRQPEAARCRAPRRGADALAEGRAQGVGPADGGGEEALHPPGRGLRRLRRL
jgi:arylsulfatase A-like enzyme